MGAEEDLRHTILGFFVVFSAIAFGVALATHGSLPNLFGGEDDSIGARKPFRNFSDFYPFYLGEHSDPTCRLLHVIGTTIVILLILRKPRVMVSILLAGSVGYMACELFRGLENGMLEFALLGGLLLITNKFLTNTVGLEIIVVGYAFAWAGHFLFEGNRPATFIYPTYSLMSDFKMCFQVYTQQLGLTGLPYSMK
eukprot:TRINITY_DN20802_c0_g1_i1.p1 TRINITY_DN20802_c0_g1~~TRINITY_DN20802_c0_g1_i1.p1  ORF type:complete len:196 (+),score=25.04 TRINITY_DN20802_c0_g1_i1:36-623(+)